MNYMNYVLKLAKRPRWLLTGIVLMAAGCGADGPERGAIVGKVTVAGQPLASGRILFLPQAPNKGPTATASIVFGEYSLDESSGPVLGVNRVEVEATPDLGFEIDDEASFANRQGALPKNPIPPEYGSQSKNTVTVAAGDNDYSINIP
jgi:hypothetical protein